jgi:hypothetical protein
MNTLSGAYFGPIICQITNLEDCKRAARAISKRMMHLPQIVFLDSLGNIRLLPGYAQIPPEAVAWMIGTYNQKASAVDISVDLANELRERRKYF